MDRYNRTGFVYDALSRCVIYEQTFILADIEFSADRWITIRIDVLGNALSTVLAAYLTYVARTSASEAGFAMSMAGVYHPALMRMRFSEDMSAVRTVGFSSFILSWMRTFNDFQVMGTFRLTIHQRLQLRCHLRFSQQPGTDSAIHGHRAGDETDQDRRASCVLACER